VHCVFFLVRASLTACSTGLPRGRFAQFVDLLLQGEGAVSHEAIPVDLPLLLQLGKDSREEERMRHGLASEREPVHDLLFHFWGAPKQNSIREADVGKVRS